ncbi:hypothetical protein LINGRAHAP2_LOCUS17038, partial [Linum grandiflorum]
MTSLGIVRLRLLSSSPPILIVPKSIEINTLRSTGYGGSEKASKNIEDRGL